MSWAFAPEPESSPSLRYGHFEVELDPHGIPVALGAGGMAMTYRAHDTVLNSIVALKVIGRKLADNPMARTRFLREARAAAQIHHPNVARVIHYGEEKGECFYAMELVEGETLEARVQRAGPLPVSQALEVIEQATRALAAAETCGVVHRDIKPSNIMIESDATGALFVKIIDYGVAKVLASQTDPTEQTQIGFIGTPAFASPEQFGEPGNAAVVDARSDIYSLGATLWFLLTGHTPISGKTHEEIRASHDKLPIEQLKAARVPTSIVELLKRMLAQDPAKRPQSASELLEAVHRAYLRFEPRATLRRKRVWLGVCAAALLLAAVSVGLYFYVRARALAEEERSIAVLPFENLSDDKTNAYFADGIQDEILTRLSKIADLKVISRTSTQRYKTAPKNLREIANQLGVAHILEGSVQKSGDAVRVNVQLIKAANDSHLWADTFDRKGTDIFSVESEVAKSVADQLRAKLTGQELQVIAARPTNNPEAYDAYLRGLAYSLKSAGTPANSLGAQKNLREAVQLDPKFALAWALLAYVESRGYRSHTLEQTDALREEARQAAENALSLQPDLGEAIWAKGFYHYACLKDYDAAERYFEQAQQLLPNSSRIPESLAYVARRRGQWDKSESYFNEAERLDPRSVSLLTQHALSYIDLRRFPDALRKLDQVLNIVPDDVDALARKANIAQGQGDLPRAAALLAPLHPNEDDPNPLETQVYQGILERRPAPMIARLKEILATPNPALGTHDGITHFSLGWAQYVAGDHAAAQESWREARTELEPFRKQQPDNLQVLAYLALTNAGLGDKAAAFELVEHGMATAPVEKDAISGSTQIEILARVAAQTGEADRALDALQTILSIPCESQLASNVALTPELLRLDPMFDPLRNDPRFQKLCQEPIQK